MKKKLTIEEKLKATKWKMVCNIDGEPAYDGDDGRMQFRRIG